jgi:hypothetical protein
VQPSSHPNGFGGHRYEAAGNQDRQSGTVMCAASLGGAVGDRYPVIVARRREEPDSRGSPLMVHSNNWWARHTVRDCGVVACGGLRSRFSGSYVRRCGVGGGGDVLAPVFVDDGGSNVDDFGSRCEVVDDQGVEGVGVGDRDVQDDVLVAGDEVGVQCLGEFDGVGQKRVDTVPGGWPEADGDQRLDRTPRGAVSLLLVLTGLLLQGRALGTRPAEEPEPQPAM